MPTWPTTWRCKYAHWPTFQVDGALEDHVPDVLPVQVERRRPGLRDDFMGDISDIPSPQLT